MSLSNEAIQKEIALINEKIDFIYSVVIEMLAIE